MYDVGDEGLKLMTSGHLLSLAIQGSKEVVFRQFNSFLLFRAEVYWLLAITPADSSKGK